MSCGVSGGNDGDTCSVLCGVSRGNDGDTCSVSCSVSGGMMVILVVCCVVCQVEMMVIPVVCRVVCQVAMIVIPVVCCVVCQVEMMEEHIQNNSEFTYHLLTYNSRSLQETVHTLTSVFHFHNATLTVVMMQYITNLMKQ